LRIALCSSSEADPAHKNDLRLDQSAAGRADLKFSSCAPQGDAPLP
jgi:hypothetical protein